MSSAILDVLLLCLLFPCIVHVCTFSFYYCSFLYWNLAVFITCYWNIKLTYLTYLLTMLLHINTHSNENQKIGTISELLRALVDLYQYPPPWLIGDKFCVREKTHSLRLHAKFHLDCLAVSCLGQKNANMAVFSTSRSHGGTIQHRWLSCMWIHNYKTSHYQNSFFISTLW